MLYARGALGLSRLDYGITLQVRRGVVDQGDALIASPVYICPEYHDDEFEVFFRVVDGYS